MFDYSIVCLVLHPLVQFKFVLDLEVTDRSLTRNHLRDRKLGSNL